MQYQPEEFESAPQILHKAMLGSGCNSLIDKKIRSTPWGGTALLAKSNFLVKIAFFASINPENQGTEDQADRFWVSGKLGEHPNCEKVERDDREIRYDRYSSPLSVAR